MLSSFEPSTTFAASSVRLVSSTTVKISATLDAMSIDFIARAPFLVLATSSAEGAADVSPKGDLPGFVLVEDDRTLFVPERKGNRMILSLQNILANPKVALLFMVPGTDETLRVQGRATLTSDPVGARAPDRARPARAARHPARDRGLLLSLRQGVQALSAVAARRAGPERYRVSFGKQLAPRLGGGDELAKKIDDAIEADYRENL